jgi:hypothetical protein
MLQCCDIWPISQDNCYCHCSGRRCAAAAACPSRLPTDGTIRAQWSHQGHTAGAPYCQIPLTFHAYLAGQECLKEQLITYKSQLSFTTLNFLIPVLVGLPGVLWLCHLSGDCPARTPVSSRVHLQADRSRGDRGSLNLPAVTSCVGRVLWTVAC